MLARGRSRLTSHLLRNRHRHGIFDFCPRSNVDTRSAGSGDGRPTGRDQCGHPGALGDHAHRLRSSIFPRRHAREIAAEKAGILKPGVPAVFAEQPPKPKPCCAATPKRPYTLARDWAITDLALDARRQPLPDAGTRSVCPLAGRAPGGKRPHGRDRAPPAGRFTRRHRATRWPGRLEQVSTQPEIILDGAHNPAGARALADYIRAILLRPAYLDGLRRDARQSRRST